MCLFHLEVTARITWLSKPQRRRTNLGGETSPGLVAGLGLLLLTGIVVRCQGGAWAGRICAPRT